MTGHIGQTIGGGHTTTAVAQDIVTVLLADNPLLSVAVNLKTYVPATSPEAIAEVVVPKVMTAVFGPDT
jgi:hypothetical protein